MRFRPELLGVVESPLVQIATVAEATPGALKLCYGESDMPTPEFICRAAYDARTAIDQVDRAIHHDRDCRAGSVRIRRWRAGPKNNHLRLSVGSGRRGLLGFSEPRYGQCANQHKS